MIKIANQVKNVRLSDFIAMKKRTNKITAKQLSQMTGLTTSTINAYTSGTADAMIDKISKLLDGLGGYKLYIAKEKAASDGNR